MKFVIAVFLPASPFIPTSPFLLTLEIFANLPVCCTLTVYYFGLNLPASPFIYLILFSPSFYLKLESKITFSYIILVASQKILGALRGRIWPFRVVLPFKVRLSPSKIVCFICLSESPLTMMKNGFYFILKELFVLKIFKFLSRYLGHLEKWD